MDKSHLRGVHFFSGLKKQQLEMIARQTDELDIPEGQVLAREGEIGHEFFVIQSGAAEVTRDGAPIGVVGAGDFFGEIALIREERRVATVTATEPMSVIVMTRASFRDLCAAIPTLRETVVTAVDQRLAGVERATVS